MAPKSSSCCAGGVEPPNKLALLQRHRSTATGLPPRGAAALHPPGLAGQPANHLCWGLPSVCNSAW